MSQTFKFSKKILMTMVDNKGQERQRLIRVMYPYRPDHCLTYEGFGHPKCGEKAWAMVALVARNELIISLPDTLAK